MLKNLSVLKSGGGGCHSGISYASIIDPTNLLLAWKEFRRGKTKRPAVISFERGREERLFELHARLSAGEWQHGPYRTFTVSDPKPRLIHAASVENRIVHHAFVRIAQPVIDTVLPFDTWACRTGKGTHAAVERARRKLEYCHKRHGRVWTLKMDIRKYFATIDHTILLNAWRPYCADDASYALMHNIVESYSPGLPLGNLTSQLCANLYLHPLDRFIQQELKPTAYLRYCDDILLIHHDREWLEGLVAILCDFVHARLYVSFHPNKIHLRPWYWGVDWLGYILYPDSIAMRSTTHNRMWRAIDTAMGEYLCGKQSGKGMDAIINSYRGCLLHTRQQHDVHLLDTLFRCLL